MVSVKNIKAAKGEISKYMDALLLSGIRPQLSLVRGFVIVTESFVRNIRVCCLHLQNRGTGVDGVGVFQR